MSNTKNQPGAISPSKDHDSQSSIMKSTTIISLGTLSSRVLGFLRDIVIAKLLGTGFRADAFFVAQKIPNLFRDLAGEGATNAAVVPVLSEYKEKQNKEEFWAFVSVILALGLIVLSVITILGIIFTPWIIRVIAPGFSADPHKFELTVKLTKLLFPYLVFIGLTAYSMGILFTFRSFFASAFSPCLLNIAVIASAWLASGRMEEPVFGLAIGVLVGGVLQLLAQVPSMMKTGIRLRMPTTLRHPGAQKIGKLLIPRMMGSGVYQLTVFIDTFCASLSNIVGPGGISAVYYSNRIIQFPMGVFGVAMASAVLPSLSGMASKNDMESLKKTVVFSLENIFFIMCPTTVILLFLSNPIVRVFFQRGEFDLYSTDITSTALAFYSIGLFGFGGIKILVTAFHALQDTKTPVKVAALCLLINATLNVILMFPLKVGGIALASSIAGTVDFLVLLYIFDKRVGGVNSGLLGYLVRVMVISAAMGVAVYWCWNNIFMSSELIKLIVIGTGALVFYGMICLIVDIPQAHKVLTWIQRGFRFKH